jgi:hypothetical protein
MEKNLPSGQVLTRKSYQRQPPLISTLSPINIMINAKTTMTMTPMISKIPRPASDNKSGPNSISAQPASIHARKRNTLDPKLNDISYPSFTTHYTAYVLQKVWYGLMYKYILNRCKKYNARRK